MALNWIFGGSGFGKSHYVYNEIMQRSENEPDKTYIVIVPEQFTMQTQKDMVMLSKAKGIMNIDVLSFVRLAYRVLEGTNALKVPVLEDEGKGMIIRKILKEHDGEWKTFGKNIGRLGFVEEIKSIVTEFIQYRIDEDEIKVMKNNVSKHSILDNKLSDLNLVYRYFKEYMEEHYIASEELLSILADYVADSGLLKDCVMCIDGFTGFTPVQYVLLKELMKVCGDIYITVTIDRNEKITDEFAVDDLFYMSKDFISKCNKIAKQTGTEISEPVWTGREDNTGYRFVEAPEIGLLEKEIFRNNKAVKQEKNEAVKIYEAINPYEEAGYVVWKIRNLVKNNGLRYRDIAIISGDTALYQRIIGKELEKCQIPYFADNTRNVLDNVFVNMLVSLLNVVNRDFEYRSVMSLLKNGFVRDFIDICDDYTDDIDNYLYASGMRGFSSWKKEWKDNKKSRTCNRLVNEGREKVLEVFGDVVTKLKKSVTVEDYTKSLYEFIVAFEMRDILDKIAEEYENSGDKVLGKEYSQIYRIVINLFDQMVLLMGDEKVSIKEYGDLLKTGFNEASVGVIPPGSDCIIIGDITRTRLKDIKVLFFVGVNDTIVPQIVKSGGFLSELEREILYDNDARLAPTFKERIFNERFYLYLALTKPSKELSISYCLHNDNGDEMEPSSIIGEINRLYKNGCLILRDYASWSTESSLENDGGRTRSINGLRKYVAGVLTKEEEEKWLKIYGAVSNDTDSRAYDSAFFVAEDSHISKDIAKKLYGKDIEGSVSRLEMYAACSFAHFMRYGLKLEERGAFELNIPDVGIMFHQVIEEFSLRLKHLHLRWRDVEEENIGVWTEEICDRVCREYGDGIVDSDARNGYMKDRIVRIAKSAISRLASHMKVGMFEAESYEVMFSNISDADSLNLNLENGSKMKLKGRIDRLDVCETDDKVFYKIIDYKSGDKKFDLTGLYYGLNMQLIVYLSAGGDIERKKHPDKLVIPAGAFYFHVDDPVVDNSNNNAGALAKKFRMQGPVNMDYQIPRYIDTSLGDIGEDVPMNGMVSSDVINVKVTKTCDFDLHSEVLDNEKFGYMINHAYEKMNSFGNAIVEGDVAAAPYKLNGEESCKYCPYHSICGFDVRLNGYNYRKLADKSDEQIWEEWRQKYGKED